MKRALAILTPFLVAWCPQASPQYTGTPPTKLYKCIEDGKAVYQEDLCASGPSKPLKPRDAKGIEAPKGSAPASASAPPGPAPVAVIPYTPSKPLANTKLPSTPVPCRSVSGSAC